MKPVRKFFTAYEKGREYGGPEEGGWYYTTLSPVSRIRCKAKISRFELKKLGYSHYYLEPLKRDKKAVAWRKAMESEDLIIYAESRYGENTHEYEHYE